MRLNIIKIGKSKGVIIPAKELKNRNIQVGDIVEMEILEINPTHKNPILKRFR